MVLRLIVGLVFVALLVVAFGMHFASTEYPALHTGLPITTITVGSTAVLVEVASTDFERQQGLSGRDELKGGSGMLFVFDTEGAWGIWMKDMHFALDIIWADSAGTVVTVAHDVTPNTYPQAFYPGTPARYVLEVPTGFAATHGIAEGSKLVVQ